MTSSSVAASAVSNPASKSKNSSAKKRSHFEYKNFIFTSDGARIAVAIRPLSPAYAGLISTAYNNPIKGTKTVYGLTFDLDASRAEDCWKDATGALAWDKISAEMSRRIPIFHTAVSKVVRSTGGLGLALLVPISPMEITSSTVKAQRAALFLQRRYIQMLIKLGMGADPSASGLVRDMCNWRDPKRLLFSNEVLMSSVQKNSTPVIRDLFGELSILPEFAYIKKESRVGEDLLCKDKRAETKLARLFMALWERQAYPDEYQSLNNHDGYTMLITAKELGEQYELSHPFTLKFMNNPPSWIELKKVTKRQGYRLRLAKSCDHLDALKKRADALLDGDVYGFHPDEVEGPSEGNFGAKKTYVQGVLAFPEDVDDGERNAWLTQASILFKHNGTDETDALEHLSKSARLIPGSAHSRNCRAVKSIVASIYRNKLNLFGARPGCLPDWLTNLQIPLATRPMLVAKGEKQTLFRKKGIISPFQVLQPASLTNSISKTCKVGTDGFISFGKSYYSVPIFSGKIHSGDKVRAIQNGETLHLENCEGLLAQHKITKKIGQYVEDVNHLSYNERNWETSYKWVVYIARKKAGIKVAERVTEILECDGYRGFRKIWKIIGANAKKNVSRET